MKKTKCLNISKRILPLPGFIGIVFFLFISSGCMVVLHEPQKINRTPGSPPDQIKKYFLKQNPWTVADEFVIKDEYKNPVFYVKGKLFSIGDKLKLMDQQGNELVYIKEKVLSFTPLFHIYRSGQLVGRMVKKIHLFSSKFVLDIPGQDKYTIKGNFNDYQYMFIRNGEKVALISKKWLSLSDHYKIEILPGEDEVMILTAAVIIDLVCHHD